jgi:hypothetical protein
VLGHGQEAARLVAAEAGVGGDVGARVVKAVCFA